LFGGDVMSKGNFSGLDRHKTAALIAASLGALNLCTPVQADQFSRPPRHQPIVAVAPAADDSERFMAFMDAADESAPATRDLFEHVFLGSSKSEIAPPGASNKAAGQVSIVVAEADPYFERWQKDANERLKEENEKNDPQINPLQSANPDKAVVVCEAGCMTTKDEVVYIAAIVPGILPAGALEPASSDGQPTAPQDEGSLPCIAGCYDRPERKAPTARRAAAVESPAARPRLSQAAQPALTTPDRPALHFVVRPKAGGVAGSLHRRILRAEKPAPRIHVAVNGAIVEQRYAVHNLPSQHAAVKAKQAKVITAKSWVTKTAVAKTVLAKTALAKRAATGKVAALHAWRTKVIAAKPHVQHRKTQQQAVRRPKHSPRHESYASYDMF
jgi:hypothetical protein